MAEYSANALQVVNPGETVIFTAAPVPCERGLVRWRQETGNFLLRGYVPNNCGCCCRRKQSANYLVDFGANIAVPEGETVGPISVAIALDGNTLLGTEMEITPAAVEEFGNVSRCTPIGIWKGCCQTVSVRNTSAVPIAVENANLGIEQ